MGTTSVSYAPILTTLGVCGLTFLLFIVVHRLTSLATLLFRPCRSEEPPLVNLSTTFPPSQRALFARVAPAAVCTANGSAADLDLSKCSRPLLEMDADYRAADAATFLCSGITVGEARAVGDFADYAKLSGVPLPCPAPDFDINNATPRPYRPFSWPYHQTMSLQKLDADYWLELESTYRQRIRQRQALFASQGPRVRQALPGTELARKELVEMVVQFLCERYPRHFRLVGGRTLVNHILGTEHDVSTAEPLDVLDNVPEDFAIVMRHHETGRYYFRAGIIFSAIGWDLGQKMGLSLSAIHEPVPDYKRNIERSVERFFAKMAPSKPIQRASWGLETGQPLYLPSTAAGFGQRKVQNPDLGPDEIFLRVDRQTFRRLPLSGAIVFNFKAIFTPLSEFQDEPYVPSLLLKVLEEGNDDIMRYKGTWHVEHVAKPVLESYARSQVERGLVESQWVPQTLAENPFFPGWERKWEVVVMVRARGFLACA